MDLTNLIKNKNYTNKEICYMFDVANCGGMRYSEKNKLMVLITDLSSKQGRNPYKDGVINSKGEFIYTGMGLKGDQKLTNKNQNGKLADIVANQIDVYYFIKYFTDYYVYLGKVMNNGSYYFKEEVDSLNKKRMVVKFPLKIIN